MKSAIGSSAAGWRWFSPTSRGRAVSPKSAALLRWRKWRGFRGSRTAGRPAALPPAGGHFQAACPAAPYFEYVSPQVFDSVLRRELTTPEAILKDGKMALPEGAGLGIALNDDLIDRLRVA